RVEQRRERGRHGRIESVEPGELAEASEVGHEVQLGGKVDARQEPAHVAPEEAVLARRVRVAGAVRVRVVMAVMRGPPERTALHGRGAEHGEYELHGARSLERAVR